MVREGYKLTGVGMIPIEWDEKSYGSVGEYFKGAGISMQDTISDGYPCIMYGDIYVKFNTVFERCDYRISKYTATRSVLAKHGDLFFTASGETAEEIGKCVSYQGNSDIYIGGDIIALRPFSDFNSKFLAYVQNSRALIIQKTSYAQGHSVVHINTKSIKKLAFACPPLPEQRRIAEALSDTDALIASLEKLITKKKAIKQGVMQELLTGRKRLAGFCKRWTDVSLEDILDYEQPTEYIVQSTEYTTSGVPVLTAGKSYVLGYSVESNGVCDNVPIILFDDFLTISRFINFKFKVKSSALKLLRTRHADINLRLVFEMMQMIDFHVVDHQRHWISQYCKLRITLPNKEEQEAISEVFSVMESEIIALEQKLAKYHQIKQGMVQQLLTGRIRLL
jgi:type I restriction enzyme S subunit